VPLLKKRRNLAMGKIKKPKLIVTLPPVYQDELLRKIVSHPLVDAVRYNTGIDSLYSPAKTIGVIKNQTDRFGKTLYVDFKGQQLRVAEWANPPLGAIVLNNPIEVELPAKVFFRGDDCCDLKGVANGNKIYVDPLPKHPVGKGQAVNILAKSLKIKNYLTNNDFDYAEAAVRVGVRNFMLSFVDSLGYVEAFQNLLESNCVGDEESRKLKIILKIESESGMNFIARTEPKLLQKYQLMAARDDLMIQIGGLKMLTALKFIIKKDPEAICASRLMLGLENGDVSLADISDLELMQSLGYGQFMLSDGISREHFEKAIKFWQEYKGGEK